MKYILDASAVIAFAKGEKGKDVVAKILSLPSGSCCIHPIDPSTMPSKGFSLIFRLFVHPLPEHGYPYVCGNALAKAEFAVLAVFRAVPPDPEGKNNRVRCAARSCDPETVWFRIAILFSEDPPLRIAPASR